jgi:hypothetical protein
MKTRISTIVIFFAVAVTIIFAADMLFSRVLPHDMTKKINWMLQMKDACYDFAILGSSRAYHSVDITTMQQSLDGKTGINLGMDGSPFDESFMTLQCFLEHNTIKHILLEVDIEGLDDSTFIPLRICDSLIYLNRPAVFDVVKERFGIRAYVWRYVPFFKNAEFNDHLGLASFMCALIPDFLSRDFDTTGTNLIDRSFQEQVLRIHETRALRIDPVREKYLNKILELAKTKNIPVSLFMAPYYSKIYKKQLNRDEVIAYYQTIAKRYAVPFIIYDDPRICDNYDYFVDLVHLNKKGTIEFSKELSHIFEQCAQ